MAPNPMYSPHLQYAPTFKWGGREWGTGDRDAFFQHLKRRGVKPEKWLRRHPTAAKVFDPTEGQIYSLFQPQITGIEQERKQRRDYYSRLMQDLGGFTTSVMGMLGGIGPAIGGAYNEGAETMAAAGTGFGDLLNTGQAESAAAANQVLGTIGAPEGQAIQGGDPGGVLAGLAGWIPETLMRQQGGAFEEAAGQLPKTASIEAQLMMKDLLRSASEEDEEFSSDILGVLQGLPGARQDLLNQRRSQFFEEQEFSMDQLKAERDYAMKEAYLAMAQGDRQRANEYLAIAREREERMRAGTAGLDVYGNPKPGYRINPQTGLVEKIPSKGSKKKNPVATDRKAVAQYQDDIDRYITKNLVKENLDPPFDTVLPDYQEAFEILWGRFKNTVTTKRGRELLKKAIASALRAHGIKRVHIGRNKGEGRAD